MVIIPVKINKMTQATPTIRILELRLDGYEFEYKAGQWVDCYAIIEGERKLVGYSLASSPSRNKTIEIAVKVSDNPVSEYIHSDAKVGDTLMIEGGQGDIYFEKELSDKVVLVGAGIGVAPLMGIYRYIDDSTDAFVTLIQSASSVEEMVYYTEAVETATRNPRARYFPVLTRGKPIEGFGYGRIDKEMLDELDIDFGSLFYLSGPENMIPEIEEALLTRGVPEERIKYEVWWKTSHDSV